MSSSNNTAHPNPLQVRLDSLLHAARPHVPFSQRLHALEQKATASDRTSLFPTARWEYAINYSWDQVLRPAASSRFAQTLERLKASFEDSQTTIAVTISGSADSRITGNPLTVCENFLNEAVGNAIRHGHAHRIHVIVGELAENGIALSVADNGRSSSSPKQGKASSASATWPNGSTADSP